MAKAKILILGILAVLLLPNRAYSGKTTLDPDGGIRLDGKRWFPIGIYQIPVTATDFNRFKKAGFNFVRAGANRSQLDRIGEEGLQAWMPLGGLSQVHDDASKDALQKRIRDFKDHPALAVWEHPDEALWNIEHDRKKPNDEERAELKKKVTEAIRSGSEEGGALKRLYLEMERAFALRNYEAMEAKIKELWTTLGQPDRPIATTYSQIYDHEKRLFANLLSGYRTIRDEDPDHLVWQNHAPRNTVDLLAKHAAYCDLIGCDIYPAPNDPPGAHSDLVDRRISSVGAYTHRFANLAPDKGILMVLQGFGWKRIGDIPKEYRDTPKGREPTFLESRFMAYDAIANGANGICYWGTHSIEPASQTWKGLVPVIREISRLQDFLAAPQTPVPLKIESQPSWRSLDQGVTATARKVGEDWLFIFVNECHEAQRVHVTFPPQFGGLRLHYLYEGLYTDLMDRGFAPMDFPGHGVKLLSTSKDLEDPALLHYDRIMEDPFRDD